MNKLNNKGFAISTIIYGTLILFVVLMTVLMFTLQFRYRNLSNSNLVSNSGSIENTDATGEPNPPDLSTGLIPIKYDESISKWVVTSESDSDWYDYNNQKWANAASLKSTVSKTQGTELDIENDAYAMFVWIPRYSYTIGCTSSTSCFGYKIDGASDSSLYTPGAIDIKFVSKNQEKEIYQNSETVVNAPTYIYSTTDTEDQRIAKREAAANWYTHPAFTFGDKELSGIWVGKFETTGTASDPTILPNKTSLTGQKVSEQFTTAQQFTAPGNSYGLSGDAHMMKNSEWGAVAYLSQSIYGKYGNPNYEGANKEIYINNSSSLYTGRRNAESDTDLIVQYDDILVAEPTKLPTAGTGASTTGNIYGIYDMNGGAWEYVMGNYDNKTANSGFDQTWFDEETNKKYFDEYENAKLFDVNDTASIGGAILETNSWYRDRKMDEDGNYWLLRGGMFSIKEGAGIFAWLTYDGESSAFFSFRASLISTN